MQHQSTLLTDPFLQFPTETSVRVVWFTEFAGQAHTVTYGDGQTAIASTRQLSRTREDRESWIDTTIAEHPASSAPKRRPIWRHEAEIVALTPGERVLYSVTSINDSGDTICSRDFSLSPQPPAGKPLKILLTSDHQLMPMTAANLQKVVDTIGQVDAVFHAGDLVNVADRASEWFDDRRGCAFFPCLQGRAAYELVKNGKKTCYRGGELIQNAPLFPTVGNHEVMGQFSETEDLNCQFSNAVPRAISAPNLKYRQLIDEAGYKTALKNRSFNIDTYQEIFSLPDDRAYYAVTFGDIRLVVLYITNIWRSPLQKPNIRGRYQEKVEDLNPPKNRPNHWGYGQHIFEPIAKGSEQYHWLEQELASDAFQQATYKIVMFHHPAHTLGGNIVPAYTDPIQSIERDETGNITAVRYHYPRQNDYIIGDVMPLLETAGVHLAYFGHSHLWNRFMSPSRMHFLESSNVGNSYGAHVAGNPRPVPIEPSEDYVAIGDPNGLEPIIPSIAPLLDDRGQPLPYIASNDVTVFSILETETGTVSSYRFDTRYPHSPVVKFDEFKLGAR
jgi:Calcineurin-like phosphoesterase